VNGPSLVAIVGTGRNGSTLIGRLLDGSPELWVHPVELNYLAVWDDLARIGAVTGPTVQNRTTHALTALDRELPREALLEVFEPQWQEIEREYCGRLTPEDALEPGRPEVQGERWSAATFLPSFLDAARRAYGGTGEERLLAFKTIETPYVANYAHVFPGIRFVHIIRDPLTTYASLKRTRVQQKHLPFYADGDHLQTFLEARWLPHATAILRSIERDPEHHLLVRYEDLRADAPTTVGAICAWLGVTPPGEPDRQTALGGRKLVTQPTNPSAPGVATPEHVVADMEARFGYDDVLTRRERALIGHCTSAPAARLGYDAERRTALRLWLSWVLPDADERLNRRSRLRWLLEIARRRIFITQLLARRTVPAA
jgi:hypothetical protein